MIANDLAAIHEYRMRVESTSGEDKACDRIGGWTGMRRIEIEYGDIGELARLERPNLVIQPHRLRGIDCCHLNATLGRHDGWIEMFDPLQKRAGLHLFDHVDGVINHWA